MSDHKHDWRKAIGRPFYRMKGEQYQSPLVCASCPAKAWAIEDNSVSEALPPWRGAVCDVEEPEIEPEPITLTLVHLATGRFITHAYQDGRILGACCFDGHDTADQASCHGDEKLKIETFAHA